MTFTIAQVQAQPKIWQDVTAEAQINDIIRRPFTPIARVIGKETLKDGRVCLIVTFPGCHDRHVEEWALETSTAPVEVEVSEPIEVIEPATELEVKIKWIFYSHGFVTIGDETRKFSILMPWKVRAEGEHPVVQLTTKAGKLIDSRWSTTENNRYINAVQAAFPERKKQFFGPNETAKIETEVTPAPAPVKEVVTSPTTSIAIASVPTASQPAPVKVLTESHQTNRRQFLSNILGAAAVLPAISKPQQSIAVHEAIGATKPEFWFGDLVDYFWTDEKTNERHSETGKIVGAAWDFMAEQWAYRVMWLSSTAYPDENYPLDDGRLILADVICKR